MTRLCMLNGCVRSEVPASDRGLAYGHGLFETIRVVAGDAPLWSHHLDRLLHGANRLMIPCNHEQVVSEFHHFLQKVVPKGSSGVVKIIYTAGTSGIGYSIPADCKPNRLWQWFDLPEYPVNLYRSGVNVRICRHRLPWMPALAGIKHLNRLDQVLAQAEFGQGNLVGEEGLLTDQEGNLIEAISKNVFCRIDGHWFTPDLSRCGVAGVMRKVLLNEILPGLGIVCAVADIPLANLQRADEIFLCNSVVGVWPISRLGGKDLAVGEATRSIQLGLAEIYGYPRVTI